MNLSIKNKLILLYAIITVIVIIIVGIFFKFTLWDKRLESAQTGYKQQIKYIEFAISGFFEEVENDLKEIILNEVVRTRDDEDFTNFLNANENSFQYSIGETEQKIIDIFNNYRLTHPYINSVYMGRENGSFVRSHKRAEPTQYDPRERPWYILAKNNPSEIVKTEVYQSLTTTDLNIGIEKALIDEEEIYGVVGMDITIKNLTDYVSNIKIEKSGRAVIIDENGNILNQTDEEGRMQNILELDKKNLETIINNDKGFTTFNDKSGEYYIFYETAEKLNWKIGIIIPVREINRDILSFALQIFTVLISALLIFLIFIIIGIQKLVLSPVLKLGSVTAKVASTGNLNHFIEIKNKDEIGKLAESFNNMMESIKKSREALKGSEQALIKLNEELEEKVKTRTEELNRKNIQLMELDRLKSMFIASMSHELRTPLNSIIGFTSIILQGMVGKIIPEQRKQLMMVKSSADHLLNLITDVIDVSKIEADKIELFIEDFDALELVREILDSFRTIAAKKGLILDFQEKDNLTITNDRRRVKQIIINLVSNAVKFTESGRVKIECEKNDNNIHFSVSDTGRGIREEDIGNLFKQFSRIYNENLKIVEGTGLGLYLSRKIALLLGGDIKVKSQFGKGSTFTLTLPLKYMEVSNEKSAGNRR